jgi:hypothetical protein
MDTEDNGSALLLGQFCKQFYKGIGHMAVEAWGGFVKDEDVGLCEHL